ncbi:MAG: hypothetical protein Q7R22_011310 [Verrucomicrobiota bacterium JB025]
MVECGGCEHRFRIEDEVIVRGKKFYPGEHKDPSLHRFQRVPLALSPDASGMDAVRYNDAPDPSEFEPIAPQRVIAGLAAVGGMVLMAMFLVFGANRGGALDGMATSNRMLMAGFVGLLGCGMLLYANPKARVKSLLVGLVLTCGLVALPLVFTEGSKPLGADVDPMAALPVVHEDEDEADGMTDEDDGLARLRARIGTGPLEDELARLAADGSDKHAVGLWLRDLRLNNRLAVRDYVYRAMDAGPQTHYYPRDNSDFLMVVTDITMSLEEAALTCRAFGRVKKIYPEISVIEVEMDNQKFEKGSIEKMTDKEHPAFYDLNKRELESIEVDRISAAVKRLAEAEPTVYRSDISEKMISLLSEDWVEFKDDLCRALMVWAAEPGPAGEAALTQALELRRRKASVPEEMIELIVKEKNPGVLPVIDGLWKEEPGKWEGLYAEMGALAEPTVIQGFPETEGAVRHSAVRLLGRVGGAASLPVLEAARRGAGTELGVLIDQAEKSIRKRGNF